MTAEGEAAYRVSHELSPSRLGGLARDPHTGHSEWGQQNRSKNTGADSDIIPTWDTDKEDLTANVALVTGHLVPGFWCM